MLRTPFRHAFGAVLGVALLAGCPEGPTNPGDDAGVEPAADPCDFASDCPDDGRPPIRTEMEGVWDEANQRMIIFGGNSAISEQCAFATPGGTDYKDDTWAYHARCGTWEEITGAGPSARARHMFALDKAGNRMLVWGGRYRAGTSGNYVQYNDLWAFDFANDSWSEITQTNAPTARVNAGFVVNEEGTKAYLFGGNLSLSGASYNATNELWELDLGTNTWTQLNPTGTAPSDRLFVAMVFDAGRNRLVTTGGGDNSAFFNDAQYFDDMWAYNIADNSWELLNAGGAGTPEGRFWGSMVYDVENDVYVMFGGHDDAQLGNSNDIWSFDPNTNDWLVLQQGDTYNRPAFGVCDFPPDFSNVDEEAPERRNSHAMVYASGECPQIIVSMGKTDCGAVDDVFRWVVDDRVWEEVIPAQRGEMCLRSDTGFDCTEMCL